MNRSQKSGAPQKTTDDTGHGGNIYRVAEELGTNENQLIDFSASINPLGVPKGVALAIKNNIRHIYNYPDPDAKQLRLQIAKYHNIEPEHIICGNGSTELIYLVVRALKPARVLIPAPTFSEYERACRMSFESRVMSYELKKRSNFDINTNGFIEAMGKIVKATANSKLYARTMAFLCNPNNPTGRLIRKEDMLKIAETAKNLKCYLVVDEAFIDFLPEHSVIKEVRNNPYLIVLRSMTKFYALSGLRLGYGIFPSGIVKTLQEQKEPWTVNTLAQKAGVAVLDDVAYRNKTFELIAKEKQFMEEGFKKLGIDYIPSSANYYLIRLDNAKRAIISLRKKGILVRDCSNFKGLDGSYIRVAVKSRKDNARLFKEMFQWLRA